MKKHLLQFVFLFIIISCKKDDVTPSGTNEGPLSLSISTNSTSLNSGTPVTVNMNFNNITNQTITSIVNFYLSKDEKYSPGEDFSLSYYTYYNSNFYKVPPGSKEFKYYGFLPSSVDAGDYYIIASYSKDTAVYYSKLKIKVSLPPSKITITGLNLDKSSYKEGDNASLEISYISKSTFSPNAILNFYFSQDDKYDGKDILLNQYSNSYNDAFLYGEHILNANLYIPSVTITGTYYIILKPSYQEQSYTNIPLASIAKQVTVSQLPQVLSVTGLTIDKSSYLENDNIKVNISLTSSSSETLSTYIDYYLSKDASYSSDDLDLSSYGSSVSVYEGTQSFDRSLSLFSSIGKGNYYLISKVSYNVSGSNTLKTIYYVGPALKVTTALDNISITGIGLTKSSYSGGENMNFNIAINNTGSSFSTYIYYYLSIDEKFSSDDIGLSDGIYTNIVNSDNVFSQTPLIPVTTNAGDYYLIARITSNSSYGSPMNKIEFIGPQITTTEAVLSLTGISFSGSKVFEAKSSFSFLVATESSLSNSSYLSVSYYLSSDQSWSLTDIFMGSESLSIYSGTSSKSVYSTLPNSITEGAYYIIARYKKATGGDYLSVISSEALTVSAPLAILFRNNYNANYSYMYLFIDDVYVGYLYDYSTSLTTSTACSSVLNYLSSCYKYLGSAGTHTFKVRDASSLTSGTEINSGSFTVTSGSCIGVDID